MMEFSTIPAPRDLARYIRFFWVLEGNVSVDNPFIHRATAENCSELIFYYKGEVKYLEGEKKPVTTFSSGLYAQSQSCQKFLIERSFGMLGVYLYPHSLPMLFGIPANELSGNHVEINGLLGKEGRVLEDMVMTAPSNEKRVELISTVLKDRLNAWPARTAFLTDAIRSAIINGTPLSVRSLCDESNLSVRQMERTFKSLTGFSVRLFSNLARFRHLMDSIPAGGFSMSDLAFVNNYFDQSHFIREFKRFAGVVPSEYFKDRTPVPNERMQSDQPTPLR